MKTALSISTNFSKSSQDYDCEKYLLLQIAEGNRTAFWPLWQRYSQYLYQRCLTWMQGRPSDAEEVLSEAMLRAAEKLPHYATQMTNLKGWLIRLTHNLCMDWYRQRRKLALSSISNQGFDLLPEKGIDPMAAFPARTEAPEAVLLRQEMGRITEAAIAALPDRLRQPFVLRIEQEQSYRDIAAQCGITQETARKRIQQARAILRRQLQPYLSGQSLQHYNEATQEGGGLRVINLRAKLAKAA